MQGQGWARKDRQRQGCEDHGHQQCRDEIAEVGNQAEGRDDYAGNRADSTDKKHIAGAGIGRCTFGRVLAQHQRHQQRVHG